MKSSVFNRILITSFLIIAFLWLAIPFAMALLWSLVDPSVAWSYPDLFPQKLSFERWFHLWEHTSLSTAMFNSYTLAPVAATCAVLLALPTAFAFGRLDFRGKAICEVLVLIPLVMPGFVIAIFFASILVNLGIYGKYPSILIGHIVIYIPYAIRILSVSFSQVSSSVVHAARDLGASQLQIFNVAYLPVIKPGIMASLLIIFILSIEEFAFAFVVGSPDFTTIPTILYSYLGFNFIRSNAAVVALILVIPNVFLMLVLERLLKSANPTNVSGKG